MFIPKKTGTDIVLFRTSDLEYGSGTIAFNTGCDLQDLPEYSFISKSYTAKGCVEEYGQAIIENLPGVNDPQCITTSSLYYKSSNYYVCCQRDNGLKNYAKYYSSGNTQPSSSIEPSKELFCAGTDFDSAKNEYINGGMLSTFITKANEWVNS